MFYLYFKNYNIYNLNIQNVGKFTIIALFLHKMSTRIVKGFILLVLISTCVIMDSLSGIKNL